MRFEGVRAFLLVGQKKKKQRIFGVLLPINLAQNRVKNALRVSKSRNGMAMLNSRIDVNLSLVVNMMELILDFFFSARILRGLRLAARLNLSFTKEIEDAMHELSSSIMSLSKV